MPGRPPEETSGLWVILAYFPSEFPDGSAFHLHQQVINLVGKFAVRRTQELERREAGLVVDRPQLGECDEPLVAVVMSHTARPDTPAPARRTWTPRVILGGAAAVEEQGAGPGQDDEEREVKEQGAEERGAKGRDCNGSHPAGWRPRLVEDSDPDPDCA